MSVFNLLFNFVTVGLYSQYFVVNAPLGCQAPASMVCSTIIDYQASIIIVLVCFFLIVLWHIGWDFHLSKIVAPLLLSSYFEQPSCRFTRHQMLFFKHYNIVKPTVSIITFKQSGFVKFHRINNKFLSRSFSTPNTYSSLPCGIIMLEKWCRMYTTKITFRAVMLRTPKPFSTFQELLDSGLDTSEHIVSQPITTKNYIKNHQLTQPLLEVTKTNTVTKVVELRTVHALIRTPHDDTEVRVDRINIPNTKYSIVTKGFIVKDEDVSLLQDYINPDTDIRQVVTYFEQSQIESNKK